jgi:hypothetical protein
MKTNVDEVSRASDGSSVDAREDGTVRVPPGWCRFVSMRSRGPTGCEEPFEPCGDVYIRSSSITTVSWPQKDVVMVNGNQFVQGSVQSVLTAITNSVS